jgi:membrane protein implicated in regulation of membrane protease activity
VHDVVVAVVTGAYVVFTLALALVCALALVLGASTSTLVVFALIWLVPTYAFARFRQPLGEPSLLSHRAALRPVGHADSLEDLGQVRLHRLLADLELARDAFVR